MDLSNAPHRFDAVEIAGKPAVHENKVELLAAYAFERLLSSRDDPRYQITHETQSHFCVHCNERLRISEEN